MKAAADQETNIDRESPRDTVSALVPKFRLLVVLFTKLVIYITSMTTDLMHPQ